MKLSLRLTLVLLVSTAAASVAACGSDDDAFSTAGSGGTGPGATSAANTGAGGAADSSSEATTTTTTSSSSATTGAGGNGTCAGLGDACTECEAAQCSDRYCACYDDPSCVKLAQCTGQCGAGDLECDQACWTANEGGISHGALLVDCAATTCADACPGYTALTPCQSCLYTDCSAAMNTCIANPDCTLLLYCLSTCADAGCQNGCYTAYPNGLADAGPVGDCLQMHCGPSCS